MAQAGLLKDQKRTQRDHKNSIFKPDQNKDDSIDRKPSVAFTQSDVERDSTGVLKKAHDASGTSQQASAAADTTMPMNTSNLVANNQTLFKRVMSYGEGAGNKDTATVSTKAGTFGEAAAARRKLNESDARAGGDSTTAAGSVIDRAMSHNADSADSPVAAVAKRRRTKGNSGTIDIIQQTKQHGAIKTATTLGVRSNGFT